MARFIRVTVLPAPGHEDDAPRATFLINTDCIECLWQTPDSPVQIDWASDPGQPPRSMSVAESLEEIALQLGVGVWAPDNGSVRVRRSIDGDLLIGMST